MTETTDPAETQALRELCAHFGIAAGYDDIWGKRCEVSREALLALLAEFGVLLGPAHGAVEALAAARREVWRKSLPPVVATRADQPSWTLSVRLPAAEREIRWSVTEEGGARHDGVFDVHTLSEIDRTDLDGVAWCVRHVPFQQRLPVGYHFLRLEGHPGRTLIVSAPSRCYRPEAIRDGGRVWGPAIQLYGLRSARNWGMGDFTDLMDLAAQMGQRGASLIGLNPLHALFPGNPAHLSPYSPSSRQHLNVLYIDVEAIDHFGHAVEARKLVASPEFQARLADLRAAPRLDAAGVTSAKLEVLELVFAHFRARHLAVDGAAAIDDAGQQFLDFITARGLPLRRHALFETLQAHFHAIDPSVHGFLSWPPAYQDPESEETADFARRHEEHIRFHQYLQWQADRQLARAGERCRELGLSIGLYLDLAVSFDRAGSDAWSARGEVALDASVGAPPDDFSLNGQDWGLPPLRPDRLRETGYRLFASTLRANMRGAGALRIDHVMSLMRLFWVPPGKTPVDGAYVRYPFDEMLAVVAVESERERCMVIGEDLGTVADEVRAALLRHDILSYRLLYFERTDAGDFRPPSHYPEQALVAVNTHDLPPLPSWWAGADLRLRWKLGLFPDVGQFEKQLLERAQDKVRLILCARRAGLLTIEEAAEILSEEPLTPRAVEAIHALVAGAPSAVMMVHLEDALGERAQVNLPGTTAEHPNWQRLMTLDLESLATDERVASLCRLLSEIRPRQAPVATTPEPKAG